MDPIEYLLFIPLLMYGIVLTHLFGEWKRFFDFDNWHGPYIVTIVVFTEVAVWNIYTFLDVISREESHSYLSYLGLLAAPFLFMLSVNALLDGERRGGLVDREEFRSRMRLSYFFMGCFVALHFVPLFSSDDGLNRPRVAAAGILFLVAWLNQERLVYLLGVVWLATLVVRVQASA
jgi:hypothetical protein